MTPAQQRKARQYQARHRGTKRSNVTELEDALVILAWEAELLSEGQVAAMLDLDRVTLRIKRETLLDRAMAIAKELDAPRQQRLQAEIAAGRPAGRGEGM